MIGFGRYNLLLKLGQGGMGSVYLARQKTLRRFCAVKVMSPQFAKDQDAAERFLREARATAALSHPNLVSVFDCDQHEGQYFIAMEYVEGLSLGQILRNFGALPLPLAIHFLKQAAVGLEYVHGRGIIHRDIKPDNMIVDASGLLKIMDLGLAKERVENDQGMTVTGTVMGSPHYMSPEQINDSKTVDCRTDIYSLGISFFQMITGHVPFQQTSAAAVCVAHLQETVPSVALDDPEVTQALDALVGGLTAKDREARIQSAADLLAGLEPWVANYPLAGSYQELLSSMGFEKQKVSYLLENSCIDTSKMDMDVVSAALPTGMSGLSVPSAPVTVSGTLPSPSSRPPAKAPSYLKLAFAGAGVLLLVLLVVGVIGFLRSHSRKTEPTAVRQSTPPPPPQTVATPSSPSPAAAPQSKVGGLEVKTKPENANVMVLTIAKTQSSPATFGDVPVGKHKIKVVKAGYRDKQQEVEVRENEFATVTVNLDRITGTVRIESSPAGAEVFIDNRLIRKTPCELEGGDGEEVQGEVRMEGYLNEPFRTVLKEGGDVRTVVLRAEPKAAPTGGPGQPFASNQPGTGGGAPPPSLSEGQGRIREPVPSGGEEGGTPSFRGEKVPMGDMQEGWRRSEEMLETCRKATAEQWSQQRSFILEQVEGVMKERNPNERDPAIRKSVSDIGKICDTARSLTATQYSSQKQQLIGKVMRAMQAGSGMMGPGRGGGGGMGGNPGGGGGPRW
jgi:serine/threonine protein kinase